MKKISFLIAASLAMTAQSSAQCWESLSGARHSLGLRTDGTLWSWGINWHGALGTAVNSQSVNVPTQVGGDSDWKFIATGDFFSMAVKNNGTLWAWGANDKGQLGDGTTTEKSTPVQVGSATNWKMVACGHDYAIGLRTDGTLWAWGHNNFNQLGDGTITDKTSPVQVGSQTDWKFVSAGMAHAFAIKTDGTLWGWGKNGGEIGDGTSVNRNAPVAVEPQSTWKTVCAGEYASLGIKSDGTLWGWGFNGGGQTALGAVNSNKSPMQVGTSAWKDVVLRCRSGIGLQANGTLWGWGENYNGQLGQGNSGPQIKTPVQLGSSTNWNKIGPGYWHTLSIQADGSLWSCGANSGGELGDGSNVQKTNMALVGIACVTGGATGLSKLTSGGEVIGLYPNPGSGIVNIQGKDGLSVDKIVITTIAGELVMEESGTSSVINVEGLASGVYLVQLHAKEGIYATKLIKN